MEDIEVEKTSPSEDASQLSRNRSFKSKQLVRSQAIHESHSPPRAESPLASPAPPATPEGSEGGEDAECREPHSEPSDRTQPVEIQITQGAWDESPTQQRLRTRRWLGTGGRQPSSSSGSRDHQLLSNNPRVACVCGACNACPHCRGRRRRHLCPTKQDSGIVCSDDCPDCSDTETVSGCSNNADGGRKNNSLDVDDQGSYCRCPDRKEKTKSISLVRTDSDDKTELSGPELVKFIKDTLNKSMRDRMTLFKIEKELHALVNDTGRCIVRFPVMTSYGRMLVHRCAALFQLSHHLDNTNKSAVLVSKSGTSGGRIPCTSFKKWCTTNFPPSPQRHQSDITHAKSILKRDTHSLDEPGAGTLNAARSKSLEQRERDYERVRRRIFSNDHCTQDETNQWQWMNAGPVKLLTSEGGRNKLLKVQSLEGGSNSSNPTRGPVSKSHSFGGYGRGQDAPRLLSRQGDLASSSWRLSPSSSGYRTLSLHSTDSVTPSPTGGASPEPQTQTHTQTAGVGAGPQGPQTAGAGPGGHGQPRDKLCVLWCVTDLGSVPPGAALIRPQTGQPLTNPDGSVYHFDPARPPPLADIQADHTIEPSNEKKRGRLEKQHSFMDSECESQPTDECRSKCSECRRHDACHKNNCDKVTPSTEQITHQKPASPCKNRYEPPTTTSTNHNPPPDIPTNQRSPYELTTNQNAAPETLTNPRSPYENEYLRPYEATLIPQYNIQAMPMNYNPYDSQNRYEIRPQSYDVNQKFELANQRIDLGNQRPMKLPTPEIQYLGQPFHQVFTHEEMTTPPVVAPQYLQADLSAQMAVKPMQLHEPNMAQMVYGASAGVAGVAGVGVAGVTRSPLPLYGTLVQALPEEKDHRIDPNFGYAPMDYSQCAACYESPPVLYSPYGPHPHPHPHGHPHPHRRYGEGVWAGLPLAPPKVLAPVYPIVQPQPYNVIYPQMLPQPYPMVQAAYPVAERGAEPRRNSFSAHRQSKRSSVSGSARNTPLTIIPQHEEKKVPYEDNQSQNPAQNANIPGQNTNTPSHITNTSGQNANIPSHTTNMSNQSANRSGCNSNTTSHSTNVHNQNSSRPGHNINVTGHNTNTTGQNANNPGHSVNVSGHNSAGNISQNAGMQQQNQSTVNDSNEIAAKIQQIKEQMAQLNTRETRETGDKRGAGAGAGGGGSGPEYRRRNGGNGILGSHPGAQQARFAGRQTNDESQLSTAAQAIVNSIRTMQAKNNTYQDRRDYHPHNQGYQRDRDRPDIRRRDDRDRPDRRLPVYRPSYLLRQMSPGTWCRRSPGPVHPVLNNPRRPPPDSRNLRR